MVARDVVVVIEAGRDDLKQQHFSNESRLADGCKAR